jgi:hypothetical protein
MILRILRSKLIGQCMLACGAALLLCAPNATPQTTASAAQAQRSGTASTTSIFNSAVGRYTTAGYCIR